ncbi:MAG TPA: twin-arginine translocase subunit TatC [Micromonosporaceae bacterium]|nr:twin-arginine translocase subunit TatC [Micromonosporaceae bacterium]
MARMLRRRGPSQFQRAADGSMTLVEHLIELRMRLFRASLGLVVGFVIGMFLSKPVFNLLAHPYCALNPDQDCTKLFFQLGPADAFLLRMKIALWIGLIVTAPIWLYQLWAFIAPGLHRHERKWAYVFVGIAAPLFMGGAVLAYFVVEKGLKFLLTSGVTGLNTQLEVTRYIDFVTNLILIFGVAFEFPLVALMLNFTGMVSAKKMLGWWRVTVFIFFLFSAIVTPTPDPFGMTALAICLSALYFGAVGIAFLNDRRRRRTAPDYGALGDDEISPLEHDTEPVAAAEPVTASSLDVVPHRYDDMT